MPQLYVPDLMKKLNLIMDRAGCKNLAEVASAMGVKEPTLRSWAAHRDVRFAGTVSKNGREPVIRFFCAHLPHLSKEAVIELLEGPYEDMSSAIILASLSGLATFIERKAKFNEATLCFDQSESAAIMQQSRKMRREREEAAKLASMSVLTIRKRRKVFPKEFVPLGTEFRLEFPIARRAKHFLGLQQTSQSWCAVPAAPLEGGKIVYMPDCDENGDPVLMCEEHDHGASRIVLIQSMRPFPDFLQVNLFDGIDLSRTDLGFLTRHLQDIPSADLTLSAIDIRFFAS